jgi:hypothetical protein
MRPLTTVPTARPEVGVLIDTPAQEIPMVADILHSYDIRASFALTQAPTPDELHMLSAGDQVVPMLRGGGLVRWLETGDQLRDLVGATGHHHFLYASSGPSVGQWWLAHGVGGRLVAGAVRLGGARDHAVALRPGEVVEVRVDGSSDPISLVARLADELAAGHLRAVPVARLVRDSGASV